MLHNDNQVDILHIFSIEKALNLYKACFYNFEKYLIFCHSKDFKKITIMLKPTCCKQYFEYIYYNSIENF